MTQTDVDREVQTGRNTVPVEALHLLPLQGSGRVTITGPGENRRLQAVRDVGVPTEEAEQAGQEQEGGSPSAGDPQLDVVVAAAARLLAVPMALVNLVGRRTQRRAAAHGCGLATEPLSQSLCVLAVESGAALLIQDCRTDPRAAHLDAVRQGEFTSYLGVPVTGLDGLAVGALCVLDTAPRAFTADDVEQLQRLASLVGSRLDQRRAQTTAGLPPGQPAELAADLAAALAQGQLRVRYQPQVSLVDGRTTGVEALVRWQHPERGLLGPAALLPQAAALGLGHDVDTWVLHRATADLAAWREHAASAPGLTMAQRADVDALTVSVNATVRACTAHLWPADVREALARTGIPAERLTVEVTEHSVQTRGPGVTSALRALAELGCGVSVDDVGTGSSSLALLAELPVTEVKVDGSLVRGTTTSRSHRTLVRAIADAGCDLGLDVVAEHVEDVVTAKAVTGLGCSTGQGYLWSPPVPAEQLMSRLLGG